MASRDAPALGSHCTHVCMSLLGLPVPATLSSHWPGGPCSLQLFWRLCHPTPPLVATVLVALVYYSVPALREPDFLDFGVLHSCPVRWASYRPGCSSLSIAPRFGLVSQLLNPCSSRPGLRATSSSWVCSRNWQSESSVVWLMPCAGPVLTKP